MVTDMSNENSKIFKTNSPEFLQSMERKSWIQSLSSNGIRVYEYDYDKYKFDKEILSILKNRDFISEIENLDQIHKELPESDMEVDVNQINNIVKTCYEPSEEIKNLYKRFMKDCVQPIIGSPLYYQNTPTFRFSFPKSKGMTKRDYHNDIMLGHPPEEINVWVPFTNASESKSFVLLDLDKSLKLLKQFNFDMTAIHQAIWKDNDVKEYCDRYSKIVKLNKGQFILFDSRCLHAAILNESDYTRVSMDVRVITINNYNSLPFTYVGTGRRQSKFTPEDYYSSLKLT